MERSSTGGWGGVVSRGGLAEEGGFGSRVG